MDFVQMVSHCLNFMLLVSARILILCEFKLYWILKKVPQVKSVQSASTYLLTTSGRCAMFDHLSMVRGCLSVIELLQYTIV